MDWIDILLVIILIVFGGLYLLMTIGSIFYFHKGWFKRWFHDILGWHVPGEAFSSFDGCSFHNRCKHCGKEIMQDSQGNWFLI